MPAERAVSIGREREAAIAGDVDRPDARRFAVPELVACGVEGAEKPIGAQHETLALRVDREAARGLVAIKRQRRAVEERHEPIEPLCDIEAVLLWRPDAAVLRRRQQLGRLDARGRLCCGIRRARRAALAHQPRLGRRRNQRPGLRVGLAAHRQTEGERLLRGQLPVHRADARAAVGDLAKRLQTLHTERRDAAAALARRVAGTARRARPWTFLFPAIARPEDRDDPDPNAAFADDLAAEVLRLDGTLGPGASLRAVFTEGEARIEANGAPILQGVFLSDDEGPPIVAQWNAFLATFNATRANPGKRLAEGLRRLFVNRPEAVVRQVIDLQLKLDDLDALIAAAEGEMEDRLADLCALPPAERRLIASGDSTTRF
jgi:hypothetical protein